MRVGQRLREKYTDLLCTVVAVYEDHMLVQFDVTLLQFMIRKESYKNFEVLDEDNV